MKFLYPLFRLLFQKRGHGFDPIVTIIDEDKDFFFGDSQLEDRIGSAAQIIRPDGQWDAFLPEKEIQHFSWGDTYHCTVFGTENAVQILMKALFNKTEEYTERFLGVLAGIRNNSGGSPQNVAEAWRKNGNLLYSFLPFEGVNSWLQFNSPNPMTISLLLEAHKWLDDWSFGHDWVTDFHPEAIKEALKYSPLGIGVYAWKFDTSKGIYVEPAWVQQNHWVCLYGYVEGQYWKIYDSYDNVTKKLDWNYPFKFAKRYTIGKKVTSAVDQGKSLYDRLKGKHIILPESGGEVYDVQDNFILTYEWWGTNSTWLAQQLGVGLKLQERLGNFIGVSNKDFETLKGACELAGGKVVKNNDLAAELNKALDKFGEK